MKKLLSGFLVITALAVAAPLHAKDVMTENLRIAKVFCLKNTECTDVIALELDDSYRKGEKDKDSKRPWNVLVNKQTKSVSALCDNAPKLELCEAYRIQLIERYMAGLTSK